MKRKVLSVLLIFVSVVAFSQRKFDKGEFKGVLESMEGTEVICPANHTDVNTYRDMPAKVKQAIAARKSLRPGSTNSANFDVLYDPAMPEIAQEAFQRAVDIWAELLNSDVKINVIALWQELGSNVLGSAGPGTYYRNFSGAKKTNTWYPIALAEKMSGAEINPPDDFDIVARFSSEQDWYYGTTGTPAVGQFDFTSVVLHELCHGLGFVGSFTVSGNQGSFGFGTEIPVIFDSYVQNFQDEDLIDTLLFANPSNALRNELISEPLFFNAPLVIENNGGEKVELYAPSFFDQGSSIFHLDDETYPAGTENSLMTPTAGLREINYDPGPIAVDMLGEMGWKGTSVIHKPLKDFETATEIEVLASIFSDTTIVADSVILNYVELDTETGTQEDLEDGLENPTQIVMVKADGSNSYSATIPVSDPTSVFVYFITAIDDFGQQATSPPQAPEFYWLFEVGRADEWAPVIEYYPPTIVVSDTPITFVANADDDYEAGIDTVFVEYAINGAAQPAFGLRKFNPETDGDYSQGAADEIAFIAIDGIPGLSDNDVVTFTITATDAAGNSTVIPTTAGGPNLDDPTVPDEYEFVATTLLDPITEDFVNFDTPTDVFSSTGFTVVTPTGLANGALHSHSPYKNGLGLYDPVTGNTYLDFDYNAISLYRHPIIISEDSATITFEEIVLLEPGEDGSDFGDSNFWDFVIVEGSLNYGSSWFSLTDGYDAGEDANWKELFTSTLAPPNAENATSNGIPSPAMFRTREINIYDALLPAAAGSEMLLRFRLFADQWVNGWGWAIDNLSIQKPAPKPLATEAELFDLSLSPNPTVDHIDVKARLGSAQQIKLEVFQSNGSKMYDRDLSMEDEEINHRIDTKSYAAGAYIVRLKTSEGQQSKRFIINR